ncbi:hypothetical protein MMC29_004817 [Sticta canariensis]|nr:hypothetical protein [Sticta canariensis]
MATVQLTSSASQQVLVQKGVNTMLGQVLADLERARNPSPGTHSTGHRRKAQLGGWQGVYRGSATIISRGGRLPEAGEAAGCCQAQPGRAAAAAAGGGCAAHRGASRPRAARHHAQLRGEPVRSLLLLTA